MRTAEITVKSEAVGLRGTLAVPAGAGGLVLFAHGSGSSRHSPRNRYVADVLNEAGIATLLIVGGLDGPVIGMNREAAAQLTCEHRVEIVPGATHLFEEPGKLEVVARLAAGWFQRHLGAPGLKDRSRENRRKAAVDRIHHTKTR